MSKSKNTIFVPLTLDSSGKNFFSDKQVVVLIACILTLVIGSLMVFVTFVNNIGENFFGTPIFLILGLAIFIYFPILIIRQFVLKEKLLKKIYKQTTENEITDLSPFWGIFEIKDGQINYIDGSIGYIVKLTKGYCYGRPENFEESHYKGVQMFVNSILEKGYTITYYNKETSDNNIAPLEDIEAELMKHQDTPVYPIERYMINYAKLISKSIAETDNDYYLIKTKDLDLMHSMVENINGSLSHLESTLYVQKEILSTDKLFKFFEVFYDLTYLDIKDLMSIKVYSGNRKLVTITKYYKGRINSQDMLDRNDSIMTSETEQPVIIDKSHNNKNKIHKHIAI